MILPAKPENAIFHFSLSKFRKFATRYTRLRCRNSGNSRRATVTYVSRMDPVLLVAEVHSGQNSRLSGPNILSYGTWQSDLISAIAAYTRRSLVAENEPDTPAKCWSRRGCEEEAKTTGYR